MFNSLKEFSKELQEIIETNRTLIKKLDKIENLVYAIKTNEDWISKHCIDETGLKFINLALEEIEKVLDKNWQLETNPNALVKLVVVDEE